MAWHTADEFVGLTDVQARAWAGALGWAFRDLTGGGWFTDDLRHDRIQVVFDDDGIVLSAEIG